MPANFVTQRLANLSRTVSSSRGVTLRYAKCA